MIRLFKREDRLERIREFILRTKEEAETYNVAFITHDNFCNFETLIKEGVLMLNELRSGCGLGGVERSKPERAELRNQIDVGSSVPPESPSMKPETGKLSATYTSKVMKVAESQNDVLQKEKYKWFELS